MSVKERDRKAVFEMVRRGTWSLVEASKHLGLSYRQCKRSYRRYRREGDVALVQQSRGRRSNRQSDPEVRKAILQRYDEVYEGFGPTLAAEKLAPEGYVIDHETLRRWLLAEGKWQRQRKRSPYRQRRERREHFGELVQMDGSFHHWCGADYPERCLIEMIDDATGIRLSLMAQEETTEACMRLLWQWVERYGIPKALYTDKKNVFVTNRPATLEEQLAGEEPKTAFGKACAKLDIAIIAANSPQANGCVERANRTHAEEFWECYDGDLDVASAQAALLAWEHRYNTVRPHQALGYLTPLQFLLQHQLRRKEQKCTGSTGPVHRVDSPSRSALSLSQC